MKYRTSKPSAGARKVKISNKSWVTSHVLPVSLPVAILLNWCAFNAALHLPYNKIIVYFYYMHLILKPCGSISAWGEGQHSMDLMTFWGRGIWVPLSTPFPEIKRKCQTLWMWGFFSWWEVDYIVKTQLILNNFRR